MKDGRIIKDWKSYIPVCTLIGFFITGAGVVVQYNTRDLINRQAVTDKTIIQMQKEIDQKANQTEVKLMFEQLKESIQILNSKQLTKDDMKELLKERR